jgi:anaerobic magnesium-protoporphyrin IX monomethyl ester cyclase
MRWVLIRSLNQSPYYDPELQEPLGLEYLMASLKEAGNHVLLLDGALTGANDDVTARRAMSFMPDVVGFSLTTASQINSLHSIVNKCKELLANCQILWLAGGNFITTEPEHAQKLLPDDFTLVRFEGENFVCSMVNAVSKPGLINGTLVEDLDKLKFPERPFADLILSQGWAFNIQGSRGCCGACRYCASSGMTGYPNRWRGRSAENIVSEMVLLYEKHRVHTFNFVDEDFLGPPAHASERADKFLNEIKKYRIPFSFGIQVRPHSIDEPTIVKLVEAGLSYAFMGIESDNPDDYKTWGRQSCEDPWKWVMAFRKHGIEMNTGVLMFHPHSTLRGIHSFATKLKDHGLLDFHSALNRLNAMPGSPIYKEALAAGEISLDICGPQSLPLKIEVQNLYDNLILAMAPLGPPSMHALCAMPQLYTKYKVNENFKSVFKNLKEIILFFNHAVENTFFAMLDISLKGNGNSYPVETFRKHNLDLAIEGINKLVKHNFAGSFEQLREAIKRDADI